MSTKESQKVVVGVGAVVLPSDNSGQILVLRELESNESIGKKSGMVAIPMGHLEAGDEPKERVRQEIKEETGYQGEMTIDGILGFYLIKGALGIVYRVRLRESYSDFSNARGNEVNEIEWVDPNRLVESDIQLRPGGRKIIKDHLSNKPLLPTGIVSNCL